MKKVIPVLAGLAAVGGSLWLLHRKFGKGADEAFLDAEENGELIIMDDEACDKEVEETAQ